ncbi:vacuolar protein sorting-associated protein 33A-like isoform X3 [Muntiacus reevesi]|uniref:vacuolar protein sorting-associated protein 33A-like isoform X3 n=1 Tax=Muntiacus reevesi TaxID=9886 RepID=UPI003307588A
MCSVNRRGSARDFHILFVPRRSLLCEQRFKDLGVLGSFIHREEYSLDLIPFDGDLLSMESEGAFKECYLESEQTSLYHAAKGLMTLQALYGTIPQIFGKGECARQVANMMIRMKREFTGSQNSIFPVFDNLLLLDRNVDLLSPLATQLMYEGLIDEIYGIQNSEDPGRRCQPGRGLSPGAAGILVLDFTSRAAGNQHPVFIRHPP